MNVKEARKEKAMGRMFMMEPDGFMVGTVEADWTAILAGHTLWETVQDPAIGLYKAHLGFRRLPGVCWHQEN